MGEIAGAGTSLPGIITSMSTAARAIRASPSANRFAILATGVLLLGMLRRGRHRIAGIGFESALVLALYLGSVVLPLT